MEHQYEQIKQRHQKYYHYARALYEFIEFFGEILPAERSVYHGLNMVLYLEKYKAVFGQPISISLSTTAAQDFSGERGIILELKPSTNSAKYIDAAFFSDFPKV